MPLSDKENSALAALLRRQAEVEAWLDGPAKRATLVALRREIAKQKAEERAA